MYINKHKRSGKPKDTWVDKSHTTYAMIETNKAIVSQVVIRFHLSRVYIERDNGYYPSSTTKSSITFAFNKFTCNKLQYDISTTNFQIG